jgi:acetyl esterase/lipase
VHVQYVNIRLAAPCCAAQDDSARDWASLVGQRFRAERDVVYKKIGNFEARVDLYIPYDNQPGPTALYIHGGGWANGSKEQYVLWFLPYLQLGMRVVSVQYRLSGVAPAPAAVEDCRCALKWVGRNAAKYGLDPERILVTGGSAGGHLALMTGMIDASAGLDRECPDGEAPTPKAILNYYGVTDVLGALEHKSTSALLWLKGIENPRELARRLAPLTYVRAELPPILSIHGDADESVPYRDAVRLHQALEEAHVPNQLLTIAGGRHGRFRWSDADTIKVQRTIQAFLSKYEVLP